MTNFETTMNWSEFVEVKTRNGIRNLRTAEPSEQFWDAWKSNKKACQDNGFTVGKDEKTNKFVVKHWCDPEAWGEVSEPMRSHPAVQAVSDAFPGSQVRERALRDHQAPVKAQPWDFRPELPPQGYRGMSPKQRFEFKLKCAIIDALETEMVSRPELIAAMAQMSAELK